MSVGIYTFVLFIIFISNARFDAGVNYSYT
jgi:hypothetical protein